MQHLQPNSTLQSGKYKIEKVLGQGGFGITYLAENTMLDGKVAIKEFFFKEYCDRDEATSHVTIGTSGNRDIVERFKLKFIKEARTIFKLNHPNIVRILDIFEENGTAYYVMDYIEGESLSDMVKRRGFIPEAEAVGYIKNVADALSYIHSKNMNHLDIKPGNIMKRQEDGQVFVIDFGVAKQYDSTTSEGTTTTPVGISKGYSPNEQYMLGGVQSFSPQSDVYALAATLFKLLTGNTPPEAMLVQDEGLPTEELKAKNISQNVINALDAAMQSKRKRTQSIEAFISNLIGSASSANSDDEATLFTPEMHRAEEERKRKEAEVTQVISVNNESSIPFVDDSSISFEVNGVKFKMIKVEGGTFEMKETVQGGFLWLFSKEIVQKTTVSEYFIGETQVTQALWKAVMGNNPSYFKGDDLPVESVSWNDCKKFISKLNSLTGQNFRLPTEAEWEFAARGGNSSNHCQYSGSDKLGDVAWYDGNSGSKTHAVATKLPNELGLYDMSGNVWEWCADWYGSYGSSSETNPTGPNSGSCRVYRGGSWFDDAGYCRVPYRYNYDPDNRSYYVGFRLALSQ